MNMQNLMQQAQKMQRDIQKKQEEIDATVFEGKSEWVTITMTGQRVVQSIKINKRDLSDEEDVEMLEDMISIAVNDVLNKIAAEIETKIGAAAGGLSGLM